MPSHRRTLFLPDLAEDCTDEILRNIFAPYGEILEIKLKLEDHGKYSGVIRFVDSTKAQEAKRILSGQIIGGRKLR